MKMLWIAALALNAFAHAPRIGTKSFTIKASNYPSTMKFLNKNGIDVMGVDIPNKLIDVNINSQEVKNLKSHGLKLSLNTIGESTQSLDQRYKNPAEIEAFLRATNEKFPDITKLIKVGDTLEGRSIYAIKISDNAGTDEASEPAVLYNGMHHSREVMTTEVTTDIIEYLTKNYTTDSKVKSWVDSTEIYVLPMLNLDGSIKVWEGNKMWRKNSRGGYGVDINRNYPEQWGACNGSSGWRSSQTYRGSAPASEPETKVLMNFVSAIKPVFNISYHAYSQLVIYPMGCKGQRTENREVVEGIGKEMGRLLDYVPGTAWETLYSVDGSDIDWMYAAEQVIPYVIEVSPRSDGFQPKYERRDPVVKRNRIGWQMLLDRVQGSGISGLTKEYKTIEILKDTQKVQDYRINPDGSYHVILTQGTYNIKFKGPNKEIILKVNIEDKIQQLNI